MLLSRSNSNRGSSTLFHFWSILAVSGHALFKGEIDDGKILKLKKNFYVHKMSTHHISRSSINNRDADSLIRDRLHFSIYFNCFHQLVFLSSLHHTVLGKRGNYIIGAHNEVSS